MLYCINNFNDTKEKYCVTEFSRDYIRNVLSA